MKKECFASILLMLLSLAVFAEDIRNIVVVSSWQNLSSSESTWLPDSVKDKLESNIQTYTNLQLISTNEKQIKELQKKSEQNAYDKDTAIELGKLTSASHAIFLTTRKNGSSNYTVTAQVTNLTDGKLIASAISKGKTKPEELFNIYGSGVDEITIDLCELLGVPLSNVNKYILMNGNTLLDSNQQSDMYSQEIENYNKQIAALEKEVKSLNNSTDLEEVARKQKAEAEMSLAKEKQKVAMENKKRLSEALAKKQTEDLNMMNKKSELKEKILDSSKEISEKVEKIRNLKMKKESVFGQIKIIETKKKALLEIRDKLDSEIESLNEDYKNDLSDKFEEIDKREYRKVDLINNKPSEEAKRLREEEKKQYEAEREKQYEEDITLLKNSIKQQDKELLKSIEKDYEVLKGERTISSISGGVLLIPEEYDSVSNSWPLKVQVFIDGKKMLEDKVSISYTELTGKTIPSHSDQKKWNEYADEVDLYDSLFKLNEPLLLGQISYSVEPLDQNSPSSYRFTFKNLSVFDARSVSTNDSGIISGKKKWDKEISSLVKEVIWKETPAYDIRDRVLQTVSQEKKDEEQKLQAEKKAAKITAYKNLLEEQSWAYVTKGNGGRGGAGVSIGYATGSFDGVCGDLLDLNFPITGNIYMNATVMGLKNFTKETLKQHVSDSASSGFASGFDVGIGFNLPLHFGRFHPNFFVSYGLGNTSISTNVKTSSSSKSTKKVSKSEYYTVLKTGADFPVSEHFGLNFTYEAIFGDWGNAQKFSIGLLYLYHMPFITLFKEEL